MVKIISLLTLSLLCIYSQAQESKWFSYETSLTGDFIKGVKGGISHDFTYIGLESLCLSFNLEEAGLWKGGELFFQGLNTHGALPSETITGDLQVFSNLESGDYTGLYEYYLKQSFGNFSVLLGQHDLNSEFVGTEYGGTFINSSFGIAPTLSLNMPVSIYPIAAPAIVLTYNWGLYSNVKLGVYDGNPGDAENNRYNLQPRIHPHKEGLFNIIQYEWKRNVNDQPENIKAGVYYHSGEFCNYSDTNQAIRGNYGAYFISDIAVLSSFAKPYRFLGVFLQGGICPDNINQVDYYLGGGFHLNGILPKDYSDALGVAFAYAHLGSPFQNIYPATFNGELTLEGTYKFVVSDIYTIQPNLQYIIQPAAGNQAKDALVFLLRFNISLCSER